MKTIKYIFFIIFIFPAILLNAQKSKIEKGEKSYEVYSYEECIRKFESVTDKTPEIKRKLAESYLKTGDFVNAERYYGETARSENAVSEDYYNYASVLKLNKNYSEADKWMEKFYKTDSGDSRAKIYMENREELTNLLSDKDRFKVKNTSINTSSQDFGTAYYGKKQVVFASSRPQIKLINRIWNWNQQPFLDLYIADINHSDLENVKQFKKKFNKKYHEGPASFNKAGDFMAYTLNNYNNKSKDGIIKLQIYTSEKKNNKWQDPVSLPFNSSEYSVGHPALTEDGNTMYFASDMPGGYGGTDIYVTKRNESGEWSKPVNLGKTNNTEGNEMFPFIHKNGILFYASDGLFGLGGLDVFMSKKAGDQWLKPQNIGAPVNTNYDDFAFIINDELKSGFLSSNREDGKGDDDIYSFRVLKPLTFDIIIKGKVKDTYGNILANAEVILFNQEGNPYRTVNTDGKGNYSFTAKRNSLYTLEGSKPKYISSQKDIDTKTEEPEIIQDLVLEKMPDFIIHVIVSDSKSGKYLEGVKVTAENTGTGEVSEIKTTDKGDFYLKQKDKNLYDTVNYSFVFEKEGYAAKTYTYNEVLNRYGEYDINISMNKIEVGEDLGKLIEINPIYFDFDKYNIRPDAAKELDKIVKIMNEYPNMEIELSSYTDCRGSSIYNLKLSDKRAKASADYIKKRISNPTRISGRGYGETKPVNDCRCEGGSGKGLQCTEEQHQQNRRTEFKIIRK